MVEPKQTNDLTQALKRRDSTSALACDKVEVTESRRTAFPVT